MCIYQPFRLANLNNGCVCVTPIGDSLRMGLVVVVVVVLLAIPLSSKMSTW